MFHRVNFLSVLLWLVEKDWCGTILEQMWASRFERTVLDVSGVISLMEVSLQNPGSLSVRIVGHSDPRRMIDSLRRKRALPLIVAAAKKFSCSACEETYRRKGFVKLLLAVHMSWAIYLQVDQFEVKHPVLNLLVLGTIMVDARSPDASVTNQKVMDTEHGWAM